jgi:hypothetical protein
MSIIKRYESYKINIDIEQNINDILSELSDDGFKIDIDFLDKLDGIHQELMLVIYHTKSFNSNLFEDYLTRIVEYINISYEIVRYNYSIYRRIPSITISGQKTFTTETEFFKEFPNNIEDVEAMGVDILIKTQKILIYK